MRKCGSRAWHEGTIWDKQLWQQIRSTLPLRKRRTFFFSTIWWLVLQMCNAVLFHNLCLAHSFLPLRLVQILNNNACALFHEHERAGPADKTASRRKWLEYSILRLAYWLRHMVCNTRTAKVATMLDIVPTDFCSLPMIIDSGSHATAEQAASSSPCPQNKATSTATEAPRTQELFESSEDHEDEDDATVADVILEHVENAVVNFSSSLANAFTSKLRNACISVLKHTESSVLQETADTFPYDDDARFLD